jgi:acetamidase/formamidase
MSLHRLSRDQIIWSFGLDLQPVLEIEPGDVVTFETHGRFSGQIRSEAPRQRAWFPKIDACPTPFMA